jgi:PAS domain S-box-containing protein
MSAAPVVVNGTKHVLVAAVDITERKQAERAGALLAAVVATSTDAIVSKTLDGIVTSWNLGAEQLFGYRADEMIGQSVICLFPPERQHEEEQILSRLRRGEPTNGFETIRLTKDGRRIEVSASTSPIRDSIGKVSGASTIIRDITQRKRVEAALRESEARLRAALQAGNTGTFHWDIRANTIDSDAALDRLFGFASQDDLRRLQDFVERIHPDDRAEFAARVARSTEHGEEFDMEFRVVWPDGSVHWLYDRGKVEVDDQGRPAFMTGACVEITKRKQAEERALRAFTELESIYASAPVGLCVISPEGRFLRINQRLAEINGVAADEHIGKTIRDIVPSVAATGETILESVVRTGEPVLDVEITGETPARPGVRRTWLQQWSPTKDELGRVVAVNVVAEEITARKEAEEALARSNALLRALTDTTPGLIYVKDREGRLVMANPATLTTIGKPWEDVRGKNEAEYHFDEAQAAHIMEVDRRVMDTGEVQTAEEEFSTSDGVRTFFAVKSPLRDAHGIVVGLVGVSSDITERKRAEEHLQFVMRELSHRTKNLFAVVLAIANQTARQVNNFNEFSARFAARVQALARAHDLLVHSDWIGASLDDVVRAQTQPFTDRIEIHGPRVSLRPEAVQNLSLALHELATNATKYGALSSGEGKVSVAWRYIDNEGEPKGYHFEWREAGGPTVVSPERRGFGSTVLSRIAESSFGGPAKLDFEADGVRWTLQIPAHHVTSAERVN